MDPGTGFSILATAIGSRELLVKILGPTADYIGDGVKDWTERGVENVSRIFQIANKKIGEKLNQDGGVPPKILKGILDEGQFCDDLLSSEYFGGILASSRSDVSRDDRGTTLIALLSRLSVYQIRAHYIFYFLTKKLFNGRDMELTLARSRSGAETYIPATFFATAMALSAKEVSQVNQILSHIMFGLNREGLIEPYHHFGTAQYIQGIFSEATSEGIIYQPSVLGIELFLWAYGRGDLDVNQFLNPSNEFQLIPGVVIGEGFKITKPRKPKNTE